MRRLTIFCRDGGRKDARVQSGTRDGLSSTYIYFVSDGFTLQVVPSFIIAILFTIPNVQADRKRGKNCV